MRASMPHPPALPLPDANASLRHPARVYFLSAFGISWAGAFAVASPWLLRGQAVPKFTGLMMFPVMLLGPALTGILLTARSGGRKGLRALGRRMTRLRIPLRWYAVLLLPPALVLAILTVFAHTVSPVFVPNRFFVGVSFGLVAGFLEEIGWTGYAFPAMARSRTPLAAAVQLGVLWGLWHIPVVDYLGAASPHGRYWLPFLLAFIAAMSAMRVLICWSYAHTESIALAQLLHASSTGALVVFSPHVSAGQETLWYFSYALVLWIVVAIVAARSGSELKRRGMGIRISS